LRTVVILLVVGLFDQLSDDLPNLSVGEKLPQKARITKKEGVFVL